MLISPKSHYDVDLLAKSLVMLGREAAAMPPAYMGAGICEPCILPKIPIGRSDRTVLGKMMDGKGLLLNCDLKSLGIKKPLPYVYERSFASMLFDKLGDERAAITTYDGIIAARAASQFYDVMWGKQSITTVASSWSTMFQATGIPTAGTYTAIPGGAAYSNTSTAALNLGQPQPSSNTAYLLTVGAIAGQQINCFLFADLLVAAGPISLTSASSQSLSSLTALTRYTTGAGVFMTFHVTTLAGATAQNLTVTYTNQAGTASQSTGAQALTASAIIHRMEPVGFGLPMELAAGDYGVRTVASVICSAANTAGALALNLYKPLAFMPGLVANVYGEKDTTISVDTLVPLPVDGSGNVGCIVLYVLTNTTSTGVVTPVIRTIWG